MIFDIIASEYGYTIDQFLDLTARQVQAFLNRIHIRNTTNQYYQMAFHAKLKGAEIRPLEEILGIDSVMPAFDEKTDKALETRAQKLLAERRAMRNV